MFRPCSLNTEKLVLTIGWGLYYNEIEIGEIWHSGALVLDGRHEVIDWEAFFGQI